MTQFDIPSSFRNCSSSADYTVREGLVDVIEDAAIKRKRMRTSLPGSGGMDVRLCDLIFFST